jgi:hypothetical protein
MVVKEHVHVTVAIDVGDCAAAIQAARQALFP